MKLGTAISFLRLLISESTSERMVGFAPHVGHWVQFPIAFEADIATAGMVAIEPRSENNGCYGGKRVGLPECPQ